MNRKFLHYTLLLAASFGVVACNSDSDELSLINGASVNASDDESLVFGAVMEDGSSLSKASLNKGLDDRISFSFAIQDSMSVFSEGANSRFTLIEKDSYASYFKGDVQQGNNFYALFPYQANASINGNVISASIPSVQDGVPNSNYSSYILSVAYATSGNPMFKLKNACSLLWIDAKWDAKPYKKIVVESNKQIAGDITIKVDAEKAPVVSGGTSSTITVNNPANGLIPVVPQESADLKITFVRQDNTSFVREYKNVSLLRSEVAFFEGRQVIFQTGVASKGDISINVANDDYFEFPNIDVHNNGMNFAGWLAEDGTVYAPTSRLKIGDSDMKYSATWSNNYMVVFNDELKDISDFVSVEPGNDVALPDCGSNDIYTFQYWLVGSNTRKPGDKLQPKENVIINASYNTLTYRVSCKADGGVFDQLYDYKNIDLIPGSTVNLKSQLGEPIKEGYEFGGYYMADDVYYENRIVEIDKLDGDVNLAVRWYKKYTIAYKYPDGSPIINKFDMEYIDEYSELSWIITIPDPADYSVDGVKGLYWFDQNGKQYRNGAVILTSDLDVMEDFVLTLKLRK